MREEKISITRVLDAPRERVFAAWTRAEHLAHWFGPAGFTLHSVQADARPGGIFQMCFRSPDGKDYWVRGVYREVVPPERLVILCTADDAQGTPRLEETIDVKLLEEGGRTTLDLKASARGVGPEAGAMLDTMPKMWAQTVARLGGHVLPKS
jgi:uncharacterized protein YndB with AHSA1/START domain